MLVQGGCMCTHTHMHWPATQVAQWLTAHSPVVSHSPQAGDLWFRASLKNCNNSPCGCQLKQSSEFWGPGTTACTPALSVLKKKDYDASWFQGIGRLVWLMPPGPKLQTLKARVITFLKKNLVVPNFRDEACSVWNCGLPDYAKLVLCIIWHRWDSSSTRPSEGKVLSNYRSNKDCFRQNLLQNTHNWKLMEFMLGWKVSAK